MTLPAPTVTNGYITLPVTTDAVTLQNNALDFLATSMPGWTPREGHLEVWLLEAMAQMMAETAQVAAQVPLSIFQYFGQQLLGLAPIAGVAATVPSTWTLTDTLGHTIPAGTRVAYLVSSTTSVVFTVQSAVTVAPGSNVTATGGVILVAQTVGTSVNGLAAGAVTMLDNLAFVLSVATTAVTSGGVDAENQLAYLNRLSADLQLLTPRPIIPSDFSALARNRVGVARAVTLDGYQPPVIGVTATAVGTGGTFSAATYFWKVTATGVFGATGGSAEVTKAIVLNGSATIAWAKNPNATGYKVYRSTTTGGESTTPALVGTISSGSTLTFTDTGAAATTGAAPTTPATGNARTVTVVGVDATGQPLSSTVQTDVITALAAQREVNFIVNTMAPTYTSLDISVHLIGNVGADLAAVTTAATAALTALLNPATWGGPSPAWTNTTVLRYLTVATILGEVTGVEYISSLTMCVHGGSLAATDVTLTGPVSLPTVGALTVNVTAGP